MCELWRPLPSPRPLSNVPCPKGCKFLHTHIARLSHGHFSTSRNHRGHCLSSSSLFTLIFSLKVSTRKAIMFRKTIYGAAFKDVNFVPLQSATFCVQCELISTGNTPYCLACGNNSLLSLSRVLGGSLRQQQTAHLITDTELDSLVRDLLRTVPDTDREVLNIDDHHTRMPSVVLRSQLRVANAGHPVSGFRAVHLGEEVDIHAGELNLEPAISAITERAQHL